MTGTFYLNDNDIKSNIALADQFRNAGNIFAIATGNNYENFLKVIKKYNIQYDYLILDQGSLIIDNNKRIINTCYIEKDVVNGIIEEINTKKDSDMFSSYNGELKICNIWTENSNSNDDVTKIALKFKDIEQAKKFTEYIKQKYNHKINAYTMIFSEINIVEIISYNASKNDAAKVLADSEKMDKANIYTVGDGYNDIEMINNFNGYCMNNSVDELLHICNNHIASVSELLKELIER